MTLRNLFDSLIHRRRGHNLDTLRRCGGECNRTLPAAAFSRIEKLLGEIVEGWQDTQP